MGAKLVDESKMGPELVAERLLKAVDQGAPHVLPMADARWFWRLRRWLPGPVPPRRHRGGEALPQARRAQP